MNTTNPVENNQTEPPVIGGLYQNFKNKETYKVIAIAKHSETLEDLVIYTPVSYKNELADTWARPISIFCEIVDRDGVKQERFKKVG